MNNTSLIDFKELDKITANVGNINKTIAELNALGSSYDCNFVNGKYNKCIDQGIDIVNSFIRLSNKSNIYSSLNPIINSDKSLIMSKEGNIYHFVLNDLLPHRRNIKDKDNYKAYTKLKGYLSLGYKAGVEEYLKEHKVEMFSGRVLVCFINHFSKTLNDLDNLDQKPFIDIAINKVLVSDDSYNHLSHLMIGQKSDKDYTEVFVGYSKDIFQKLEELQIEY